MADWRRDALRIASEVERRARLEEYVFVPLDPNTATDEEMLTIPGAGNRMVREFKEYRPWKTVEQFRKEIGKYVPPATVAHFERYFIFQ